MKNWCGGDILNGVLAFVLDLIVVILRVAIPVLAIFIIVKTYSSLRHNRRDERPLIMLFDEYTKKAVPVLYWENSIGRSKRCDIFLNDATVSREHAVLLRRDDGWSITDTGSKAGVFVNGEKISERTNIYLSDKIRIGATTLVVKRAEEFEGATRRSWFFRPNGKNSISKGRRKVYDRSFGNKQTDTFESRSKGLQHYGKRCLHTLQQ